MRSRVIDAESLLIVAPLADVLALASDVYQAPVEDDAAPDSEAPTYRPESKS